MKQKFDKWNNLKQKLESKEIINFKQGEIYFMSVGQNIGYEVYGKKELYLRPVLVYRKLSKQTFVGIPLSSKEKNGTYFFTFRYTPKTLSTALLNQIRVFDIKQIEIKLLDLLKITSQKGKFGHSSKKLPKNKEIVSNNDNNVNKSEMI